MTKRVLLFTLSLYASVFGTMAFTQPIQGRVICFGDSITHGAKVDGNSWVWILNHRHQKGVTFINEGKNGRKTSDRKDLIPVLKKYPDASYYLVLLGVNDLKNGNDSMVNNCIENMQWMIDKIHTENPKAKIVLLAPPDINVGIMSQLNKDKRYNWNTKKSLQALEKAYRTLAKREHIGFISLLHAVSDSNYADGLHPNVAGQRELARTIWEGLNGSN